MYQGQIVRQTSHCICSEPDVFDNLELIKYLEQVGIGWQMDLQLVRRIYREYLRILQQKFKTQGQQIGNWKELSKNYQNQIMYDNYKQVVGKGNIKIQQCNIQNEIVFTSKLVTYNGEYNMNNMKVGRWDICWVGGKQMYILMNLQEIFQIYYFIYSGGGSYDNEGNEKKIGKWVELVERFSSSAQATYNGEYNMKGQNVGIWVEKKCNYTREEKRYDDRQNKQCEINKNYIQNYFTIIILNYQNYYYPQSNL